MKNGRNGVSNRTSVNEKTWDMMKKLMHTPATLEKYCLPFSSKSRKARAAMNQKWPFTNVKTVAAILIRKNVPKQRETSDYISQKVFWKSVRNLMKIF